MIKLPKVSSEIKYKNQYFVHETKKKTFNKKHLDLTTKEYQTHQFVNSLSQPVKDFLGEQVCSQLKELNYYDNWYECDDKEWYHCLRGFVNTKHGNCKLLLIKRQQNKKHKKQDNTITLKIVPDPYFIIGERFWEIRLDKETGEIVSSNFDFGLNPLNMTQEEYTLFCLEHNIQDAPPLITEKFLVNEMCNVVESLGIPKDIIDSWRM